MRHETSERLLRTHTVSDRSLRIHRVPSPLKETGCSSGPDVKKEGCPTRRLVQLHAVCAPGAEAGTGVLPRADDLRSAPGPSYGASDQSVSGSVFHSFSVCHLTRVNRLSAFRIWWILRQTVRQASSAFHQSKVATIPRTG